MERNALTHDVSPTDELVPPRWAAKLAAWLAWSLAGLSLAMFVACFALYAAVLSERSPASWGTGGLGTLLIFAPFLAFSVVGALIVSRQPNNLIGWICVADGFLWMLTVLTGPYTEYGLANPGSLPYPVAIYALTIWLWVPAVGLLGIYLPLLFPDGRFPSPRWWFLALFAGVVIVCFGVALLLTPGPLDGLPQARNPIGVKALARFENVGIFVVAMIPACILAAAASLISRFRRSGREVRQQIKWLALAASFVGLAYAFTIAGTLLFASETTTGGNSTPAWLAMLQNVVLMSYAAVPLAVGVAVLRHRLFDVDVVINRALVYGALTAIVVGVYVALVGYLGVLFRSGGNLPISLVAAGLVAVLFAPLKNRLQRVVDRLMYGERDDPYAAVSRLGRRLEATLAPDAVLPVIVETLREALKIPYAAITLDGNGARGTASSAGEPSRSIVRLPLSYQNEKVGELLLGPRPGEDGFSEADLSLLSDLALQAGIAAHAVRLTDDLQRSRERLVNAREEERRRLRRDLHDDLGAQLAGLNVQMGVLRRLIVEDQAAADGLTGELQAELRDSIASVRRLVYDLRPPALDELGLTSALGQLADRYGAEDGRLRVRVETPGELPPLPAAVEVAAYRISQEALTNVVKHAGARDCVVRLTVADDVSLEILDDGAGIPEENNAGVGLLSMHERAAELGGTCTVEMGPEFGTRVLVHLPLPEE
jgi:signal transduction histidine kinase